MSRYPSVLRRYTPPTCTLEVIAKDSALSRWARRPVLKDLRFRLSLDDPKLSRDQWIMITGNQSQLSALGDAVTAYVQHFLETSHERLNQNSLGAHSAETALLTVESEASAPAGFSNPVGVSLQPRGLLSHDLYWGELATEETGASTQLSTIQLFDLANALDEYTADAMDLPNLQSASGVWVPNWAQVAAVVLLAVGLSTSVIRLFDGTGNIASVAPTTSQGASSTDQKIATQLPPSVVDKTTPPAVSSLKLPPPPTGASPVPQPGLPQVATPSQPNPTPEPTTVPPNEIATYPVPDVPGRPTITLSEPAPGRPSQQASAASKAAPETFAAAPEASADSANQLNQSNARQGVASRQAESTSESASGTAFDTIPQVAEVRSYFQQRWTPPDGLEQVLEYSLQIDANGTIQTITPLKQASGDFIDRTGMPLLGDPFVSPLKGRQTAKIRLVLEPNGQVRSFLEE